MRLFVAVPLPDPTRQALAGESRVLSRQVPGLRWVRPENWHLTLFFLGQTQDSRRDALIQALGNQNLGAPFEIELGGGGAFPDERHGRVLWLGVRDGSEAVAQLHDQLRPVIEALGFTLDERPFVPHLTLLRPPKPADFSRLMAHLARVRLRMRVERVVLFHSRTLPEGARYEEVEEFPLRGYSPPV